MIRGLHAQSDVRTELWHSFLSMLRSYAAAAGVHGMEHGVLILSEDSLDLAAGRNMLKVRYHRTLGRGLWSLHEGTDRHQFAEQPRELEQGDFDVNLDGTITLIGEVYEMDYAAIQLIAALTLAASRNEVEVPA